MIAAAIFGAALAKPAGLRPAHMSAAFVLSQSASAAGASTWPARVETWNYVASGVRGVETGRFQHGRFVAVLTYGPFTRRFGDDGKTRWMQDAAGFTRRVTSDDTRDAIDTAALESSDPDRRGVSVAGTVTAPMDAVVLYVDPPDGRPEYRYYDRRTMHLVRVDAWADGRTVTTTYDDYRTTGGLTEAWHRHVTNGLPGDDSDWRLQSATPAPVSPPAAFAPPPDAPSALTLTDPPVTLPASFAGDRVILQTRLAGHPVDLQLDSGASSVLLNRDVAAAAHFAFYGSMTQVTAGVYQMSHAAAPQLAFGGLALHGIDVRTADFGERAGDHVVAGLAGYDLFAGCVVEIDYAGRKVIVQAPDAFKPPAGAFALPIRLDDGVPMVTATVDGFTGDRFIIDTGADNSILFRRFLDAHPRLFPDQTGTDVLEDAFPLMGRISGVGGQLQMQQYTANSLAVGKVTLPDWPLMAAVSTSAFGTDDDDGLIGQDFLRNFDVYLDYPKQMIYLVPNQRYHDRWG